jgi:hypothetical protein
VDRLVGLLRILEPDHAGPPPNPFASALAKIESVMSDAYDVASRSSREDLEKKLDRRTAEAEDLQTINARPRVVTTSAAVSVAPNDRTSAAQRSDSGASGRFSMSHVGS